MSKRQEYKLDTMFYIIMGMLNNSSWWGLVFAFMAVVSLMAMWVVRNE